MMQQTLNELGRCCESLSVAADAQDAGKAMMAMLQIQEHIGAILADAARDMSRLSSPVGQRQPHRYHTKNGAAGATLNAMRRTLVKGLKLFPPSWRHGLSAVDIQKREAQALDDMLKEHGGDRDATLEFVRRSQNAVRRT